MIRLPQVFPVFRRESAASVDVCARGQLAAKGLLCLVLLPAGLVRADGDLGPKSWAEPMRQVHARFTGASGTLACFGDSITFTMAFWSPLSYQAKDLPPDAARAYERVKKHMNAACWAKWKGPEYGNQGSMTIRWARQNVDTWLGKLNPETAVILFGTNDLTELSLEEFEQKTGEVVDRCLLNGTVAVLTTLPPRSGLAEKAARFADAVRRIAREKHVPLIDYHAAILSRRPDDWDGSLPKFKNVAGDTYDVPTLIARDGVHPSNPKKYQAYTSEALRHNGYALRNYLTLLVYADVIENVLKKPSSAGDEGWPVAVEKALVRAATNRVELVKALRAVPQSQRKGMTFLIANMPDSDLKSLRADFLLENVGLAYEARKKLAWGQQLPEEVFLNNVLPYANVDEARDPWRKQMFELCLPLVKDCKTPGEAAHRLNSKIFTILKVRYGTNRKQPHQSPKESIELGVASCTGLSILLSDACRSVAVPARLVGTPMWVNMRGNHTWVEIWNHGWHFTGACEADPQGLDRGWFSGDAGQAEKDSPLHAIYAASFKKTGVSFPLVWAPERRDVFAENVTGHYAKSVPGKSAAEPFPAISNAARSFFAAGKDKQKQWHFDAALDRLLADKEEAVRMAVWKAYREVPIHAEERDDFARQQVRYQKHLSAYTFKKVGKRPETGWPLFIAMHGGGGVPKNINDSQWQVMQRYYKDQNSVPGYLYLALRAPNDSWNGFYDEYVPPLIANLIRQFLIFGDVDSDKVFLMGYSHGGYGAFFVGPKIPDRFAAIHASAAAPTDNTISPRSLRNTRFTFMIGEHDEAYGRRKRCEAFNAAVQKLKAADKDGYPVVMELKQGFGHGGLPDRDKIKDMYSFKRNPVPRHLTWDLTDSVVQDFFWLSVPQPGKDQSVEASIRDNTVRIVGRNVKKLDVYFDGRLVALNKPVRLIVGENSREVRPNPSLLTLCQALLKRGDPRLAFCCRVRVEFP